jgi:flagellin
VVNRYDDQSIASSCQRRVVPAEADSRSRAINVTSIITNIAAQSALQTMRALSAGLDETQNQISSGLRVGAASDNVAYWSISTTMRSDNKAIASAADALAVGEAKSDVAYAGTSAIIDVLSEFKAKLVSAKETSMDASKIQSELSHLNKQAEQIVRSSSFSGVNWLATGAPDHIRDADVLKDSVVSSFIRNSANEVSINLADIDLRRTTMLNNGGGGILQKDILDYYMPLGAMYSDTYRHEGHEDHIFNGPQTFSTTDSLTFDLVVDRSDVSAGDTFHITVDKTVIDAALGTSDGVIRNAFDLRDVFFQAFRNAGADSFADLNRLYVSSPTRYEIQSLETTSHVGSSIYIDNIQPSPAVPEMELGLKSTSLINHDNMLESTAMNFVSPFKVMLDATISFDLSINNQPLTKYVIDRATVDTALGTTDGMITNANDLQTIIQHVTVGSGLDMLVSGNKLSFFPDQDDFPGYGNKAANFYMSSLRPNPPFTLRFDLAEIDITSGQFTVDEYLEGVEFMLKESKNSASIIGSLQQRIERQLEFSALITDVVDTGISRLVDTDMEEASAKLSALQTQQQLAIQSLQIANTSSENLMTLFRQ